MAAFEVLRLLTGNTVHHPDRIRVIKRIAELFQSVEKFDVVLCLVGGVRDADIQLAPGLTKKGRIRVDTKNKNTNPL